jgi:bacillithiol system protein YtxJ
MEMDNYLRDKEENDGIEFELIDVIDNRDRSEEIAELLGIEHESPQVILTDANNQILWTASHRRVTEKALKQAIAENK